MSIHDEVIPFDMMVGGRTQTLGFGELLHDTVQAEAEFHKAADEARKSLCEVFGVKLDSPSTIPKELDDIVQELWETGWDPETRNVRLFTRDFGLPLTEATVELLGGRLIFRSATDVFRLSIFYADQRVEAFPFHKAFKCVTQGPFFGETMTYFVIGLGHELERKGFRMTEELKRRMPRERYAAPAK